MSLEHAILGFLQYKPLSGYDLKQKFNLSVQHFWPADQSQIYRTLSHLALIGLARMEVVAQDVRPDRKVYHITAEGRAELRRWLSSSVAKTQTRSAGMVQVFFAGQLGDEELLAMFRAATEECRQELAILEAVPAAAAAAGSEGKPRDAWCWFLTLECGLQLTRARLAWLEGVIARLERGEAPALQPPSPSA